MGFSNTPSLLSGNDKYDNPLNVNDVYQTLLDLQEQRVLLSIFSARRNYDDMLIKSLAVTNDAKTENALFITVAFKQIILVSTRVVRLHQNVQANPAQTTGATNLGTIKTKAPKGKIGN